MVSLPLRCAALAEMRYFLYLMFFTFGLYAQNYSNCPGVSVSDIVKRKWTQDMVSCTSNWLSRMNFNVKFVILERLNSLISSVLKEICTLPISLYFHEAEVVLGIDEAQVASWGYLIEVVTRLYLIDQN